MGGGGAVMGDFIPVTFRYGAMILGAECCHGNVLGYWMAGGGGGLWGGELPLLLLPATAVCVETIEPAHCRLMTDGSQPPNGLPWEALPCQQLLMAMESAGREVVIIPRGSRVGGGGVLQ